jgi:hypothetical protein
MKTAVRFLECVAVFVFLFNDYPQSVLFGEDVA